MLLWQLSSSKDLVAVTDMFSKVEYVDISLETNNLTILIYMQPGQWQLPIQKVSKPAGVKGFVWNIIEGDFTEQWSTV